MYFSNLKSFYVTVSYIVIIDYHLEWTSWCFRNKHPTHAGLTEAGVRADACSHDAAVSACEKRSEWQPAFLLLTTMQVRMSGRSKFWIS